MFQKETSSPKQRFLRVVAPSPLSSIEHNSPFTFTVVPPPGYSASIESIPAPWVSARYQLSWFGVAGKVEKAKTNKQQIFRRFAIFEAEEDTNILIQFLFTTPAMLLYNPYFKVYPLSAVKLEKEDGNLATDPLNQVARSIITRLSARNEPVNAKEWLFESTQHSNRNYAHRFPSTLDSSFGSPDEGRHVGFSAGSGTVKGVPFAPPADASQKRDTKQLCQGRYVLEIGVAFVDLVEYFALIWTDKSKITIYTLD